MFGSEQDNFTILWQKEVKPSENIAGKGESACNQHFLLLPRIFQPFCKSIQISFILPSANALNFDQSKILSFP